MEGGSMKCKKMSFSLHETRLENGFRLTNSERGGATRYALSSLGTETSKEIEKTSKNYEILLPRSPRLEEKVKNSFLPFLQS